MALVLTILAKQVPVIDELAGGLRCITGLERPDDACMHADILTARADIEAARLEAQEAVEAAQAQVDALRQAATTRDLVFEQGGTFNGSASGTATGTLVVGSIYLEPATRQGLLGSICWVTIDQPGYDPRIAIASRSDAGDVRALTLDPLSLAALGMDAGVLSNAVDTCPWPGGSL